MHRSRLASLAALLVVVTACNRPQPLAPGARFELFIGTTTNAGNQVAVNDPATGATIYVPQAPVISSSDVVSIERADDDHAAMLNVCLTPQAAQRLGVASSAAMGKQFVLRVNGEVICAPKIVSAVSSPLAISVDKTKRDAMFRSLVNE